MKTETYKVIIDYNSKGQKEIERWFKNNRLFRNDGPAFQTWYENGNKKTETWYKNNKLHRIDGPALQIWDENGQKQIEKYYENGIKEVNRTIYVINGEKRTENDLKTINIDGKEVSEETIINALKNYFK
jgi:hypothetical protein